MIGLRIQLAVFLRLRFGIFIAIWIYFSVHCITPRTSGLASIVTCTGLLRTQRCNCFRAARGLCIMNIYMWVIEKWWSQMQSSAVGNELLAQAGMRKVPSRDTLHSPDLSPRLRRNESTHVDANSWRVERWGLEVGLYWEGEMIYSWQWSAIVAFLRKMFLRAQLNASSFMTTNVQQTQSFVTGSYNWKQQAMSRRNIDRTARVSARCKKLHQGRSFRTELHQGRSFRTARRSSFPLHFGWQLCLPKFLQQLCHFPQQLCHFHPSFWWFVGILLGPGVKIRGNFSSWWLLQWFWDAF